MFIVIDEVFVAMQLALELREPWVNCHVRHGARKHMLLLLLLLVVVLLHAACDVSHVLGACSSVAELAQYFFS
jgi:hypothetical protein